MSFPVPGTTDMNVTGLTMAVGATCVTFAVPPVPPAPNSLVPQQYPVPPDTTPQLRMAPDESEVKVNPPETGAGTSELVGCAAIPSDMRALLPQQYAAPPT